MVATIDARHQRTEFAIGGLPAPKHYLLTVADFGLGPVLGPAGLIGRAELFRYDPFQRHLAGGLPDRLAPGLDMSEVADQAFLAAAAAFQHVL